MPQGDAPRTLSSRLQSHALVARTATGRLARLWERGQVELHGGFSIQRLEQLREYYLHTKWLHIFLVRVSMPLPALVVVTLIDCMPLERPDQGSTRNYVFWIRLIIVETMIIGGALHLFRCCIPSLDMRHRDVFSVAFAATVAGIAFVYGMSFVIGFPVPFTFILQSPACMPVLMVSLTMLWRKPMQQDKQLRTDLIHQMMILSGQLLLTYAFAVYFFAFTSLQSLAQSAFTFVLPFMKLAFKNYFSRLLQHSDDVKPAFIVFNVDVFSSLYVANSLQASQSTLNTILVMIVDILQLAISMYDIRAVLRDINVLIPLDQFDGSLLDLCHIAASNKDVRTDLEQLPSSKRVAPTKQMIMARRAIHPADIYTNAAALEQFVAARLDRSGRVRLVSYIAKLLFMTEFVLLIEFAEVIVPVIFSGYLSVMSHLPNRAYYPQLASLTAQKLTHSITSVMTNASLEFASLLVTTWFLYRYLKLSPSRLLSFALESELGLIQASLLTWIPYIVQQSLVHLV